MAERRTASHLLRSGKTMTEVAHELNRRVGWVSKWRARYRQEGWRGLQDRSRAPNHQPRKLPEKVCQAIRQTRSELEAEALEPDKLSYIGAQAIHTRLGQKKVSPLPSLTSIERVLRNSGLTRPGQPAEVSEVSYPHLRPAQPHQLLQVDSCPHYLPGGQGVACFNAIDGVSRYPTGQQFTTKRSQEAAEFMRQVGQELGSPVYTQVDNEGCFSGGFTHPYVLGKVLGLALWVGTQLVYAPGYHPESKGTVERFHQDYNQNVWNKVELRDLADVRTHSSRFFTAYQQSGHHSALKGRSPAELHHAQQARYLPASFEVPAKLPLTVGQVHFIPLVNQAKQITLLKVVWSAPAAQPNQGVWATLEFTCQVATVSIYDAAPDAPKRPCSARHPFPLKEPVGPQQPQFCPAQASSAWPHFVSRLVVRSFHEVMKVASVVKVLPSFTIS